MKQNEFENYCNKDYLHSYQVEKRLTNEIKNARKAIEERFFFIYCLIGVTFLTTCIIIFNSTKQI